MTYDIDDAVETEALLALADYVRETEHTIINALTVHAEKMTEAAVSARRAYEAGQSDGLITNQGYRMSAELFEQEAAKCRAVAEKLSELSAELDK